MCNRVNCLFMNWLVIFNPLMSLLVLLEGIYVTLLT